MGAYKAGSFLAASGVVTVSGIGMAQIQGVVLFGSNQATEDAVVTNGNAGAFMGMMALDGDGVTIRSQATSIIPTQGQVARGGYCIVQQSAFNAIDYSATPVAMGGDSFSVNFNVAPGGSRRIHYLAWGDFDNWDNDPVYNLAQTVTPGWQPQSLVAVGTMVSGGGVGDWIRGDLGGYTFGWYGAAAYPLNSLLWKKAMLSLVRYPFTGQIATRLMTDNPSSAGFTRGAGFLGPFLTEVVHAAYPVGTTQLFESTAGGFNNYDLMAYWDGSSAAGSVTPSGSLAGTVVETVNNPDVTEIAAVLLYGANGWQTGPGVGSSGQAIGFGVKTDDYQGCVMVNQGGNYLFQSGVRSWCSAVGAAGANAGTIDLDTPAGGQFTLETAEHGVSPQEIDWIAFGPAGDQYIPQIYRWFPGNPV